VDTFIAVVTYNDAVNCIKTVESLLGQGRIVVWDNGSTDGTAGKLHARFGPGAVTVHEHHENAMWTPALNSAIEKYYDGEKFIMLSNNDIIYRPNVVKRLSEAFLDEKVGIAGPTGRAMGGLQDFETHWRRAKGIHPNNVDGLPTVRANFIAGASFMYPGRFIEEIGPLDGSMPLGADDHDYCVRVKNAEYHVVVVNSAYIGHMGHRSGTHAKEFWEEWGGRSWAAFEEKWAGYWYNELEAIRCHWNPEYVPGWDFGTGWMTEEVRKPIWEARGANYEDTP
jgi:GT2 family glycosyltransferase